MAQLVAVCRAENHQFRRRQLPLVVDDSLTVSLTSLDFEAIAVTLSSRALVKCGIAECGK